MVSPTATISSACRSIVSLTRCFSSSRVTIFSSIHRRALAGEAPAPRRPAARISSRLLRVWRRISRSRAPKRAIRSQETLMKAAAAVAEILKREGVKFLIGYPVNPIIEAAAEADIRTIIVRQERTGLHMADAVSRISSGDRVGVFAMQHG